MPEAKCLTTKEVARLCKVSDATVKRWEEAGQIKSERTSGGHRRFRAEEVARFQRNLGLGLKQCPSDESVLTINSRRRPNKNHSGSAIFQSLVAGFEEEAADILITAYLKKEPLAQIFDNLICPAMRKIGELWYSGELSIAQEHLATRSALNAVYKLRGVLPVTDITGEIAMCCAFEGDFHEIPTHLAQLILENEGYEVINFGANTPLYSFTEEVGCYAPNLICFSATMMTDIERLARDYKEFRERIAKLKIPIVLGGRAFYDPCLRSRFPAELFVENFKQLNEFAQNIADKTRI
ncbi:MAG: B12-binding domain-containing protein [Pyrinomonadaceae bacterium]